MRTSRRRLVLLSLLLGGWTAAVTARLVQIQILRHDHYVNRATKQQERILALPPARGSILDSRGRILAESVAAESLYADPQAVTNPGDVATRLAAVRELGLSAGELEKKLRAPGEFVWIARQVNADVARRVQQLRLPGIYSLEEPRRSYPKGALAANLLGYVGIDGEGLGGIEHSWDRYVRGRPGKVTLLRDARRGMYLLGGEGANAAVDGLHVVLTIDEVIQFITERALHRAITRYRAAGGSVVVMDPKDGSILAMASRPTFDPNRYREFSSSSWRNQVVQNAYEPGSTFKIVTAAAALEEQVVTPSQMLDCGEGQIVIANIAIREHGGARFGLLSFEDVIAKSSNVGTIHVAMALGRGRFYRHIRRFGFGERTGIDVPGEAMGILRSPERWSQISAAEISIGQEIGTTPLQMVQAISVVGNGGLKYDPRIVDRVVDDSGRTIYEVPMSPPERVISERTAAILNEMLKTVVTRGTGSEAALKEHVVAGKTGTAQKAGRGGYLPDKVIASFGGYVPADRPRLAILVVVNEPKGEQYGGVIAAPVFREIAEASLRYLGVAPSIPGRRLRVSEPVLAAISQGFSKGRRGGPAQTPNLIGADARAAIAMATAAGWEVRTSGSGVVVRQNPAPGVVLERRGVLELTLQSSS
jgi:cell division protein FtsI (penicillin-binding protein 3)